MKTISSTLLIFLIVTAGFSQSIKTTVQGKGSPVLLLPGFASTQDVWNEVAHSLGNIYELHLVDYAGFGNLPPVETPFLATVTADLKQYVATVDNSELIIIGHSMGGTIATWLAAQKDLKIKQIIVVDGLPASGALMFPGVDLSTLTYDSPYNNQMLNMDEATFENTLSYMLPGMATQADHQSLIKTSILNTDRKTYVYGYTDYLKFDVRENLKDIDVPVLILGAAGMYGKEAAQKTFKDQYQNLADYQLMMHETSKHFIMYDDPEWMNEQMKSFLDQ